MEFYGEIFPLHISHYPGIISKFVSSSPDCDPQCLRKYNISSLFQIFDFLYTLKYVENKYESHRTQDFPLTPSIDI